MDMRFLSYHYSPLKVIDMERLNHENIAKFLDYCRESDPF
uniref:Uncharacterized protein n=1 Tax=Aegilops tauschii subsp. strangulata TaxID=200361 RepID=A0A452Y521_AEGTS